MEFEPYTELSPIKPNKPVLDLEQGVLYLNGNTMQDLEAHAIASIKTIEFDHEPLDIIAENRNIFTNLNPQPTYVFEVTPCDINKEILLEGRGPWKTSIVTNQIQKRKHHKTRINKKWAKKYGYWIVKDTFDISNIEAHDLDKEHVTYNADLQFRERRIY